MHRTLTIEAVIDEGGNTNNRLTGLEASNVKRERFALVQPLRKHYRFGSQRYLRSFTFDYVYTPTFSTDLNNTVTMDI